MLLDEIAAVYPGLERGASFTNWCGASSPRFVEDAIDELRARLVADAAAKRGGGARGPASRSSAFSPSMAEAERDIKDFLFRQMYRHEKVMGVWERAREAISRLFPAFFDDAGADAAGMGRARGVGRAAPSAPWSSPTISPA